MVPIKNSFKKKTKIAGWLNHVPTHMHTHRQPMLLRKSSNCSLTIQVSWNKGWKILCKGELKILKLDILVVYKRGCQSKVTR